MKFTRSICFSVFVLLTLCACNNAPLVDTNPAAKSGTVSGTLADGALWKAEVPSHWNGKLLLFSRGFRFKLMGPMTAPESVRETLLGLGYGLLASDYPSAGWAVGEAIPSQMLALTEFEQHFGKPSRIIAWGNSMGGMVTSALAELHSDAIDGALAFCASSAGAIHMMNMSLDGAFALTQLFETTPAVGITGVGDNRDGVMRLAALLKERRETKAGLARIALAGVFGGVPGWTKSELMPDETDVWAQAEQIAEMMPLAVFPPRGDQEHRAGGRFSSNIGIDYAQLLEQSGRKAFVQQLYRDAGLDLDADIAKINNAPRLASDPKAVAYMQKNFTPAGKVGVPVLSVHTLGDGMTSPFLQQTYVETIAKHSNNNLIAAAWIQRPGHCTQSAAEIIAAVKALETRIDTREWHISAAELNTGDFSESTRYIDVKPVAIPRFCSTESNCGIKSSLSK